MIIAAFRATVGGTELAYGLVWHLIIKQRSSREAMNAVLFLRCFYRDV